MEIIIFSKKLANKKLLAYLSVSWVQGEFTVRLTTLLTPINFIEDILCIQKFWIKSKKKTLNT